MNRVCILKSTGKLVPDGYQSGGDDNCDLMQMRLNTLVQNAINAGYKEDEVEAKWVTEEESAELLEANKPKPTYADLRRAAYPLMADYLDGIVKGDVAQVQKYIDACNAIKAAYPKQGV